MKERIKEVLKRVFELDEVKDDISQTTCIKWDSLNHLNLVVELEDEFGVSFEPEDIAEMKSLETIEMKLKALL
ncbi:MAG: acyl carrier protein [Odoribacter splanchnicus]